MSAVWEGYEAPSGQPVAIKVLDARHARDPVRVRALRDEIRAVAALDHPHVVSIYGEGVVPETAPAGLAPGSPWLAMELVGGGTLQEQLPSLDWPGLLSVLDPLLQALGHAHARGVVHRDLKPGNVLIAGKISDVRLADFGLRIALDEPDDLPLGGYTPQYAAPEQLRGAWREQGPWTDLYALGCIVWRALTGGRYAPDAPWQIALPVPDGLRPWLARLLAERPAERYPCAALARRDLLALPQAPARRGWRAQDLPEAVTEGTEASPGAAPRPPEAPLRPWRFVRPPLVGRESERARLGGALAHTIGQGRASAVILRGPSGVGKSALARAFTEQAYEEGLDVLRAVHDGSGPRVGLGGMIGRRLRLVGLAGAELRTALERVVPGDTDDLDGLAAVLATPDGSLRPSAAELVVRHLARQRPLVLWLDDVQWGLDALELARRLLDSTDPVPILLVLTLQEEALAERPEEEARVAELLRHPEGSEVSVGELVDAELDELVQTLVPGAQIPPMASSGRALHAVHLLELWAERPDQPLPDKPAALWQARLQGLPGDPRALELLACLGARVDLDEWSTACLHAGVRAEPEQIERLVERRLGHRSWGSSALVLAHARLRQALLERCPDLAPLHLACAEALSVGSSLPWARIGRHLYAAGAWERAVLPLLRGAERSMHGGAYADTRELLALRKVCIERAALPAGDSRHDEGVMCEWRLAMVAGAPSEAVRLADEALERALRWGWSGVEGMARLCRVQTALMTGGPAREEAERARAAGLASKNERVVALATLTLGKIRAREGDPVGLDLLHEAALQLGQTGQDEAAADAWTSLATVLVERRDFGAASRAVTEAERVVEQARLGPTMAGLSRSLRGAIAVALGRPAEARHDFEVARRLLAPMLPYLAELAEVNMALLDLDEQAWARARARVLALRSEALAVRRGVHLVLLATDVEEPGWEAHAEVLERTVDRADPAGARTAELAMRRALAAGRKERAGRAAGIALEQMRRLGDGEGVERVRRETEGPST
jgi:hypothetical protein